jgi:hypothetical protein
MTMMRKDWIHAGEVIIIGLLFFAILVVASVSAISWGGDPKYFNYSINVLPNNSYVHQGENISQGNYYDLSGIYGFSGVVASWKDDDYAGITQPEYVITLSHPRKVYIGSETFPPGRYYQWDGGYCYSDSDECTSSFGHGNAYVFAVVGPVKEIVPQDRVVTRTANITEQIGDQTIVVQVTYNETIKGEIPQSQSAAQQQTIIVPEAAVPTNTPVTGPTAQNMVDTNGNPVGGITGNYEQVTPKTPPSIPVILLSIIAAIGVLTWRNKRG